MPKAKTTSETTTKKPRKAAAAKTAPTHDEIAARAYQIYQQRGYTPGDPMQDWLRAEQELTAAKPKKASRKTKVVSIAA